jgi:hypothetical protein
MNHYLRLINRTWISKTGVTDLKARFSLKKVKQTILRLINRTWISKTGVTELKARFSLWLPKRSKLFRTSV